MTAATLSFQHDHALIRFARRIKTCYDASELYQIILSDVRSLVPCQRAILYLFQEQTQQLLSVASSSDLCSETVPVPSVKAQGEESERIQEPSINIQDMNSIVAWAARHRHPLLHNGELSEIAVPLLARNVLHGVLVLQRFEPFHVQERRCACGICNMAAIALENMELSKRCRADQEQMRVFLSTISHELRSPLNTINGYLELALSGAGGELNAQQHEFVQRARMGSEHLYALLEDLLLISRADADQLRLN